jgi:hypothetical protein
MFSVEVIVYLIHGALKMEFIVRDLCLDLIEVLPEKGFGRQGMKWDECLNENKLKVAF